MRLYITCHISLHSIPFCTAPTLLSDNNLLYDRLFFHYPRYPVRGHQLATNIVTKHSRLRKGAVINGSGAARVVTVAASAYNSERAVRWLNASVRNKAPTMQSSLTSSSRVNRASRDRGRGEISGLGRRRRTTPPRRAAAELLAYLRGRQIDDPILAAEEPIREWEPSEAIRKNRIARRLMRTEFCALFFQSFLFIPLYTTQTYKDFSSRSKWTRVKQRRNSP